MVGRGGNKKREREREFGIEWNAQRIVIRCEEKKKKKGKKEGKKYGVGPRKEIRTRTKLF